MLLISFDNILIQTYFHFAVIVIGIFALVDFLVRFKRPLHFKICFSILLSSLLALEVLLWIEYPFFEIVKLSPFINTGLWTAGLCALSILTTGKIEKWILLVSGFILTLNLYNYFSITTHYVNYENPNMIFSLRFSSKFTVVQLVRYVQRTLLLFSIVRLYRVIKKNKVERNIYQKKLVRWVGMLIGTVIFSLLLNILVSVTAYEEKYYLTYLLLIFNVFCLGFFLLTIYRPYFLNNHETGKLDFSKYILPTPLKLSDQNFYTPFFTQAYYLNKDAGIEHFCKQNGIEESDSFNEQIIKEYSMSFANLINKKRVDYFIEIARNPAHKNFTIEALAKESGFNSRTALYKPFKKFHGGTPIDYLTALNS